MLEGWLKASALFLSGYYKIYVTNHCFVLREELLMAVKNVGENYKCNLYSNESRIVGIKSSAVNLFAAVKR